MRYDCGMFVVLCVRVHVLCVFACVVRAACLFCVRCVWLVTVVCVCGAGIGLYCIVLYSIV